MKKYDWQAAGSVAVAGSRLQQREALSIVLVGVVFDSQCTNGKKDLAKDRPGARPTKGHVKNSNETATSFFSLLLLAVVVNAVALAST